MFFTGKQRGINRVRREIVLRDVNVAALDWKGPSLLYVTFKGEALTTFESDSFDDHIKFIFTDASGQQFKRDYTPILMNKAAGELVIAFAVHAGGKASDWATSAKIGDSAIIAGPKGSMVIPMDYDWHFLVGDESSFPAIERRLKELPAGMPTKVLLKIENAQSREEIAKEHSHIQFVSDNAGLINALQAAHLPSGEGFVWCAGESNAMKKARDILIHEKNHPKSDMKVAAYWKVGEADFHDRLV
ncbi:siderophore-interacting protein [Leeia sp. TBRC 13508]|uniref:Siderophore-interacting protein n=1 Tax=Leeia speluncae TaxID=2884804 RepID=A0ABS8D9P4_9NEIS|nr:siderophore-interacting protein [Leeia speluncae]MCB6184857.1 siderophore-interacting protein [Leeia speluncae]